MLAAAHTRTCITASESFAKTKPAKADSAPSTSSTYQTQTTPRERCARSDGATSRRSSPLSSVIPMKKNTRNATCMQDSPTKPWHASAPPPLGADELYVSPAASGVFTFIRLEIARSAVQQRPSSQHSTRRERNRHDGFCNLGSTHVPRHQVQVAVRAHQRLIKNLGRRL